MEDSINNQMFRACHNFFQEFYREYVKRTADKNAGPFFFAISGPLGSGKTTTAAGLISILNQADIPAIAISIDNFYKTATELDALQEQHPNNALLSTRGVPGTHDVELAKATLALLKDRKEVAIPAYDKSVNGGRGDRIPENEWQVCNREGERAVEVVILEGWCWGFQALDEALLQIRLNKCQYIESSIAKRHSLESLGWVNERLKEYNEGIFDQAHALIIIKADFLRFMYSWRRQAEHEMNEKLGESMTDDELSKFIDNYYACFELFNTQPSNPITPTRVIVLGEDRTILGMFENTLGRVTSEQIGVEGCSEGCCSHQT